MKEVPNYYGIIPAEVRYDERLKDKAKLLYSEITALSDKNGYCYASNRYFAELYNVSLTTISLLIKNLVDNGYLENEIVYKDGSKEIASRYLKIIKGGYLRNLKEGYLKKLKDNNTRDNNIKETISNDIVKKVFTKPSIQEIDEYCKERNNGIDANRFYDFYESKNWMIGKNKMVNWKACVRTWEQRNKKEEVKLPNWFDKNMEKDLSNLDELNKILEDFDE